MKPHPTPPKGGEHELARANYALYIVHYELNKFHITNCAVAFQATESFCLHCNLMKTTPNRKADYTVIKVVL